jgi:hypothetical protein
MNGFLYRLFGQQSSRGLLRRRPSGVEYRQRLKDGLRHAALKGLRPEQKPGLIRRSPISERGPF